METRIWRHFDLFLLLATVCLVGYGLAMIYSATYETSGTGIDPLVYHQAGYAIAGFFLFIVLSGLDYHVLGNFVWPLYGATCVMLVLVLAAGRILHGSQRWIQLGPVQFEPSQVAMLCVVMALAKYFANPVENPKNPRFVLGSLLIPAIPMALVLMQPDFGTATVYAAIWLAVLFAAGVPLFYFGGLLGVAAAAAPLAWLLMHQYQRQRILIFLNPKSDPLNTGYNAIQALISVGSGEFSGRGFLSGTQSQLHFLRVQYADFIFSVLAEELGFVGAVALLALFLIIFWRGLRAARLSREAFGRLVACGIVGGLAYQVIVNVGMNVGLLPVTGVPLPMISYGGSSLVTFMGALGILESIVMRHRKLEF
ncbi:MAG TPA: rod shape-determining protein RodA [Chloroflexota bacterium]|nr:rod shape-determining protein RodA [Chloroflexota bacterium]